MVVAEGKPLYWLLKRLKQRMRPKRVRTITDFCEAELRLGAGRLRGARWNPEYMPFQKVVLEGIEEFLESKRWRELFLSGAVQSGKTTIAFAAPMLYLLFEHQRSEIGLGIPTADMADVAYRSKVRPVIEESAFAGCIPKTGPGSKGGKLRTMTEFANGARMFLFSCGGGEEQRSSHTARVVLLTEVENMTRDDVAQIRGRTEAFGEDGKLIGECTITTEDGIVWEKMEIEGSGGRIFLRCPHCECYQYPDRARFTGWEAAETVSEAMAAGRYHCERCEAPWSEEDRKEAQRSPVLAHRGQKVTDSGEVEGDLPDTTIMGIRWNALHAHPEMRSQARIAELEWRSARNEDPSEESYLCQKVWCVPYRETLDSPVLTMRVLAGCCGPHHFNPLGWSLVGTGALHTYQSDPPEGIAFMVASCDVGLKLLYHQVDAYDWDLTRWTLAFEGYEIIDREEDRAPTEEEFFEAMDRLRSVWEAAGVQSAWIDAGFKYSAHQGNLVRQWCREAGSWIHPLVGRGTGQHSRLTGKGLELPDGVPDAIQARLQDDGDILWFLDVDQIKDDQYFRLFRDPRALGAIHFPRECANAKKTSRSDGREFGYILSHYLSARRVERVIGGKRVRTWGDAKRQHLNDVGVYSLGGAYVTRAELREQQAEERREEPAPAGGDEMPIRRDF